MIIKKKHKCKMCKQKYPVTTEMLNTYVHKEGIFGTNYYKGFTCPTCGLLYISVTGNNRFRHPDVGGRFIKEEKYDRIYF